MIRRRLFSGVLGIGLLGATVACHSGAGTTPSPQSWQGEAESLLAFYNPVFTALYAEASEAQWRSATDVSDAHTGERTGAMTVFSAFAGNALFIERARTLLEHENELEDRTRRELHAMLVLAADAPQTNPDLARRRVAAESHQSEILDGFQFRLGEQNVTANDLDRVLQSSADLAERERAWTASKAVGVPLRSGLAGLRDLRNGVAREMGHDDFFSFQVGNYGMPTAEMMTLLERLIEETKPVYRELHCFAKHELARRYNVAEVPARIPAHWLGNRWGQSWPGLVDGVDMDALVEGKTPRWIVEQAERFYVSLGYAELPDSFWERSDLFPVEAGGTRRKNSHASAWHMDLDRDVRSLMSVETNWRWFETAHHELGHIYYYMTYTRPEVPPLLREGANRSYHEGMGDLIKLASSQLPYLREVGLLREGQTVDEERWLLDSALTGPIVFLPFAAGTMSHFEKALYADGLAESEFNRAWWQYAGDYQGIAPPSERPADACDACTKTHVNDDPAQYYDYALANVLVYQLHEHICQNVLHQDPRACNYYGRREVGDFLRGIMEHGSSRDWREVLRTATGSDLTAAPMLRYYEPLVASLRARNAGRSCDW